MFIGDIKILPWFKATSPAPEKIEQKERYYLENGKLESKIIVDEAGNLIDGYTSYLLAVKYGLEHVPVRYGRRQIIAAAHRPGGKLYTWELPGILVGQVKIGDRVVVRTGKDCMVVKVAEVQEYARQEHDPCRMVIRRCGKGGRMDGYQRADRINNQ